MSVCAAAVVPTSFHAGAGSKAPVATRCVTSCARGTTNANGVPTAKTHPDRSLSFTKTAPASRARGQSITTKALAEAASGKIKIQAPPNAEVTTEYWQWEGHTIRYTKSGDAGPPLVLVHGFGGNADHWRKNTPVLGKHCRVFAIDLLGYGFSSKPDPMSSPQNEIYNFENWSRQLRSFVDEVVKEPAFLACNSVGGVAGLQAAVDDNTKVKGVILLNISLRGLHVSKQPALAKPFIKLLQTTLRTTDVGRKFFGNVARAETVKSVLREAYGDPTAVTDELVECILKPGLQPGAAEVFLDFISYSGGPLPEDLLPQIDGGKTPVRILWGQKDPWEVVTEGRKYGAYPCVDRFIELPGVGHCPMDEAPDLVNPLLLEFVNDYK